MKAFKSKAAGMRGVLGETFIDFPAPDNKSEAQMLAYTNPARLAGLARPAPWRPPGTQTAGVIQAGIARILRELGLPALIAAMSAKIRVDIRHSGGPSPPMPAEAA